LFHLGYQYERYTQTRFPSKLGDYSRAPEESLRVLGSEEMLAARKTALVSPMTSYLALSKRLLAFVHRDDAPIDATLRPLLRAHTARTFSVDERTDGTLDLAQAERDRERLLIKPCQYGGAHGVEPGVSLSPADWSRRLNEVWRDPDWVLQELHVPARSPDGRVLSFGLYSYGGQLGGVTVRAATSLVVSARDSLFIPCVVDQPRRG
jgi:hypothetical protein